MSALTEITAPARLTALALLLALAPLLLLQASSAEAQAANHAPIFDGISGNTISRVVFEQPLGIPRYVMKIEATDPDPRQHYVGYSVSGADANRVELRHLIRWYRENSNRNITGDPLTSIITGDSVIEKHFVIVYLRAPVDYEIKNSYAFNIVATDIKGASTTLAVTVAVRDISAAEETEIITIYTYKQPEFTGDMTRTIDGSSAAVGDNVGLPIEVSPIVPGHKVVRFINYAEGDNKRYAAGDYTGDYIWNDFAIDASTGQITIARMPLHQSSYNIAVLVSNRSAPWQKVPSFGVVRITVTQPPASMSAQGQTGVMREPRAGAPPDSSQPTETPPASSPSLPDRLDRPANVSAVKQDEGSILLSWEATEGAAPDYYGIRRRIEGGKYKVIVRQIADGGAQDTDSTAGRIGYLDSDGALNEGEAYIYGVRAFHATIKQSKWTPGTRSE